MSRAYPRIGQIITIANKRQEQYRCEFCKLSGVNKWVEIQVNQFRGDDDIFFFHSKCLDGLKEIQILARLYPEHYAELKD